MADAARAAGSLAGGGRSMTARRGDIVSQEKFTDFQLHVEFRVPNLPEAKGQEKGNSGVYLQGRYEIQVLDCMASRCRGKVTVAPSTISTRRW